MSYTIASSRLLLLLSFTLLLLLLTSPVNAQHDLYDIVCGNDSTPNIHCTPNSTNDKNLQSLLPSLASNDNNITVEGFYSSSSGDNPDKVYATGFCRGDLKQEKCQSYFNNFQSLLLHRCPNQKEGISPTILTL